MRIVYPNYLLAFSAALTVGFGFSFWHSVSENKELLRSNHVAAMALEAARDEVKALRDQLPVEIRAREFAEAAQAVAENGERSTRQKLYELSKARQEAEAAKVRAGAELQVARQQLSQREKALQTAELARDDAENAFKTIANRLNEENLARKEAGLDPFMASGGFYMYGRNPAIEPVSSGEGTSGLWVGVPNAPEAMPKGTAKEEVSAKAQPAAALESRSSVHAVKTPAPAGSGLRTASGSWHATLTRVAVSVRRDAQCGYLFCRKNTPKRALSAKR
ncbi:MAG: hypothetical protein WBX25_18525 [Rhodomicrobium sp.]